MDSFTSPTASDRNPDDTPSSLPPQSATGTPPPRPPTSGSIYNLLLTAVGRTPRGADTFSPGGVSHADEEEFWSALDGGEGLGASRAPQQQQDQSPTRRAADTTTINTLTVSAQQAGGVADEASAAVEVVPSPTRLMAQGGAAGGVNDDGGGRPRSTSRGAADYSSGGGRDVGRGGAGLGGALAGSFNRSRRRLFQHGAAVSESEPGNPYSTSRVFSLGNPAFRPAGRGSLLRGRSTWAASGGAVNGNGYGHDGANGRTVAGVTAGTRSGGGSGAIRGGAEDGSPDASESGRSGEGRILFYHKPTLANVPTGDVPDVVPVYLGCPNGGMALGLPLNEAWQGGQNQDTTFNQNLSYTILSWPEDHIKDLVELWRLQVLFLTTMIFNVMVAAILFFAQHPDRTRVEGPVRGGAYPGPFEQRSPLDDPSGIRSEQWHLAAALLIGLWGIGCVLSKTRAGIALYLCMTVVNAIVGLSHAPDAPFACRYAIDVVLVAMGRSYLASLTYAWVTASAGDGRRGW